MAQRFDAVIVGGGPAGAIAAIHLCRMGWRTALIERGPRHRSKTCGHCLSPRAFESLRRAGIMDIVRRIAADSISAIHLHASGSRTLRTPLRADHEVGDDLGLVVERCRFDQALVDRAATEGAEIVQPAAACLVSVSKASAQLRVTNPHGIVNWKTRLVIGADGVGSAVARRAGLVNRDSIGRKYGFSFDFASDKPDTLEAGVIGMWVANGGYLGVVRQTDNAVHIAALASTGDDAGRQSHEPLQFVRAVAGKHESLRRLGLDCATRCHMQNLAAAGPMPWQPRAVANAQVALIGDAAGYIEPFTGEGMMWAMRSAEALVSVLSDVHPGQWNRGLADAYQEEWLAAVGRRQYLCRTLTAGLQHNRMTRWMMEAGARLPFMAQGIIREMHAA